MIVFISYLLLECNSALYGKLFDTNVYILIFIKKHAYNNN